LALNDVDRAQRKDVLTLMNTQNDALELRVLQDGSTPPTTQLAADIGDGVFIHTDVTANDTLEEAVGRLAYARLYIEQGRDGIANLLRSDSPAFGLALEAQRKSVLNELNKDRSVEQFQGKDIPAFPLPSPAVLAEEADPVTKRNRAQALTLYAVTERKITRSEYLDAEQKDQIFDLVAIDHQNDTLKDIIEKVAMAEDLEFSGENYQNYVERRRSPEFEQKVAAIAEHLSRVAIQPELAPEAVRVEQNQFAQSQQTTRAPDRSR